MGNPHSRIRRLADHAVRRAVDYLRVLGRCCSTAEHDALVERSPDFQAAIELLAAHPPTRRHEVEARVLANEPIADIARKCDLPPEAVSIYESVFFDVRPRLAQGSYILHTVSRHGTPGEIGPVPTETLWKWLGYHGGPFVLDALLDADQEASLDKESVGASCVTTRAALLNLLSAALALPINEKNGPWRAQALRADARDREHGDRQAGGCGHQALGH